MKQRNQNSKVPETPAAQGGDDTGRTAPVQEITSEALLGRKGELWIKHNGERYTLRITANSKLILTK